MGSFTAVNEIYGQYFKSPFPARETVEIVALPKGARVEISCVASL
jgi:2-iminobutanoate/2-iminopropanoate deaminase